MWDLWADSRTPSLHCSVFTDGWLPALQTTQTEAHTLAQAPDRRWSPGRVSTPSTPPKAAERGQGAVAPTSTPASQRPLALPPRDNCYSVSFTQWRSLLPARVPEEADAISRRCSLVLALTLISLPSSARFSLLNCRGPASLSNSTNRGHLPPEVSFLTHRNSAVSGSLPAWKAKVPRDSLSLSGECLRPLRFQAFEFPCWNWRSADFRRTFPSLLRI